MGLPKGKTNNPNGRTKGSKNRVSKNIILELEYIDGVLASEGKGLLECAREDPKWYFENFKKQRIPKNIELTGLDGEPIQSKVEVIFVNSKDTG